MEGHDVEDAGLLHAGRAAGDSLEGPLAAVSAGTRRAHTSNSSSFVGALVVSLKSAVGVGILSAPYALRVAGLWSGCVGLVLAALVTGYCTHLLYRCMMRLREIHPLKYEQISVRQPRLCDVDVDKGMSTSTGKIHPLKYEQINVRLPRGDDDVGFENGNAEEDYDDDGVHAERTPASSGSAADPADSPASYSSVVGGALGPRFKRLANVALFCAMFGACVSYLIFISQSMSDRSVFSKGPSKLEWVLIVAPVCIVCAWLPSMRALEGTSGLGVAALLVAVGVVMGRSHSEIELHPASEYAVLRVESFPLFVGIAAFANEGIVAMAVPVADSMKQGSRYPTVLFTTLVLINGLFMSFGLVGYLSYEDHTHDSILKNLASGILSQVVVVAVCLQLLMTYPQVMFVALSVAEYWWLPQQHSQARRYALRTGVVLASVGLALVIPRFGVFIAFIGSFANSLVVYLPMVCFLKLFRDPECAREKKTVKFCLLPVCALIAVVSSVVAFIDLVESFG